MRTLCFAVVTVCGLFVPAAADTPTTGARLYADVCESCHGRDARGLARYEGSLDDFRGLLSGRVDRMPDFSGAFSDDEMAAIYAYLTAPGRDSP